jgi:hypothetical protein
VEELAMNWDALGAIANLLAAVGVLASLIYLALQVRQNTQWLRQQAFQLGTNEVRRWAAQLTGSAEVSDIFLRGQTDLQSLKPSEKLRFTMLIFEICSIWATYQEHNDQDFLGLRDSAEQSITRWIRQGWFTGWFAQNGHMMSPNFKQFVRQVTERAGVENQP